MSEHADLEALSAYVDGEAPEWADHVGGCAACAASVEELRAVAAAVGAPVAPATAGARDAAIAAALDGRSAGPSPEPVRAGRNEARGVWMLGAVAAMVLVVLGVAALLRGAGGPTERTTVAGPALGSNQTAGARTNAAADSAAQTAPTPAADLGEIPDAATLRARAVTPVAGKATPAPAAPSPLGATAGAAASGSSAAPSVAAAPAGSAPCEAQARARQPSLGPVVYYATARRQGVPAVVLEFSNSGGQPSFTLLLLAQDGCAELLRAAGP